MDANFIAINESQWILCLLQITGLMLISWIVGRIALHRLPDIAASVGIVALTASAGLIVLTWADVPRPFELNANANEQVAASTNLKPSRPSVNPVGSTAESETSAASWLSSLAAQVNWTASTNHNGTSESTWQWVSPVRIVTSLLLLTLLGGLIGVFRVTLSSKTIHTLARSSSSVEDARVRAEVIRILAMLPTVGKQRQVSVRQFNGPGSPFVSWLTGNTIFVPESFLTWSDSEQSVSLAHEIGHLQRRDHYSRLITQLTFCLTWLHPLAWLLHRQTVLAQELAADQVAVQTIKNPSAYCRGLSRLALRFDAECRQPSLLGVSISSSLIRRITMLKGMTFYRLPCSRFANRCITLLAFTACTWIGCWSVSAQDTSQEQHPHSKVVAASHTAPVKMFLEPTTAPWEAIGNQPGYVKIQINRILKHPDLKPFEPMLTTVLDSTLRSEPNASPSIQQFGLALDDLTQLEAGLLLHFNYDPKKPEGQRSSIGFGMSKAELITGNPVDWLGLVKAFDFEKMRMALAADPRSNGLDDLETVREAWIKSAEKSRAYVIEMDSLWKQQFNKQWEKPTATKKTIWEAVSGGVATVVYDIRQFEVPFEDLQAMDATSQANIKMTLATETAAWGVDLSQDFKTCYIRFAAVPKTGVSVGELLKHFEVLRAGVRNELREALAQNPDDDDIPVHPLQQLMKAKVTLVKSKESNGETTKSYLLVEGECSADFAPFLSTFSFE